MGKTWIFIVRWGGEKGEIRPKEILSFRRTPLGKRVVKQGEGHLRMGRLSYRRRAKRAVAGLSVDLLGWPQNARLLSF